MIEATKISVIVPVYGDGAALALLTERVAIVLGLLVGSHWELIFVNDGSPTECWALIETLAMRFPNAKGINLRRNFGQHNALLAGIRASRGHVLVTLDDDLQHPPEEIPLLLQSLTADLDVVYGTPIQHSHNGWRNVSSVLAKAALATVLGVKIAGHISAFRAFRGQLRSSFSDYHSPYVSIDVLLSWSTTRIGSVTVRHEPRRFGRSQYTLLRLLRHLINMVTGFSVWPLRVASIVGLVFFCFGLLVLAYVLIRFLFAGSTVPGFPFLASIVALFSGAQMFALGIMGEYLARLYFRLLDRPPYVVESTINLQAE